MPNQLIDREAASDTPRTDAAVGRTADCRWSNKAMGEAYEAVENLARQLERELNALRAGVPYREFCRHPDKCSGLGSCPRDPTCAD